MTEKKIGDSPNYVKIVEKAVNKYGSIPELQRALLKEADVEISHTALYNAQKGISASIKPQVITAICALIYDGDWEKCGKDLNSDFLPDKLRKK